MMNNDYFISEKTGEKIHAPLNQSLIHGTTRSEDLIPAFLEALCDTEFYGQIVSDLFDELDKHAPEGYYFGTLEGDGADFGYWKD